MKKKIVMLGITVMLTSCMVTGCVNIQESAKGPLRIDEEQEGADKQVIVSTEPSTTDSMQDIEKEVVQKQKENNVTIVNLSEQTSIESSNNYSIDTYRSVQDFGFALFKENMNETNPILSPVSVYIALTMVGNGAEGNTKQEFLQVLCENEDMTAISYNIMNNLPKKTDLITIELANSAWIDDEFTVKEEWIEQITSLYDAQVFQTDVSSKTAMNAMNEWVEGNTHGLIKQMIEQPFTKETRLVLFDTLYFDGKWQTPFLKETTYDEEFHVSDTESVVVPMMHQYDESYEFFETDEVKGIVMPYCDSNLAFVAILPQGKRKMRDDFTFTASGLSSIIKNRTYKTIHVKLPKFELSFDKILNKSLIDMGLVDAFDEEKADFSCIGTTYSGLPIYISLVRQKAVIKVDEEGTEAAAATEIAMLETTALLEEDPIEMYFDKPFLYFVMDMETELPLFMGIMDNPAEE